MLRDLARTLGNYNDSAEAAMRAVDEANGYRPFVAALPNSDDISVPALAAYQPRVSVEPGSLLWGISGYSTQTAGFSVQITDTATRKPLFSQPVNVGNVKGGTLSVRDSANNAISITGRMHLLPVPLIILPPGILSVSIVNLASVANTMQLCLHIARRTARADQAPNAANHELDAAYARALRARRDAGSSIISAASYPAGSSPAGSSAGSSAAGSADDDGMLTTPIDLSATGANTIIAGSAAGRICIYQLDLWNSGQQTIQLTDGTTALRGPLADFPAQMGYGLADAAKPHFRLLAGRPFVISIDGPSRLTGFVKYRIE